MAAPTHAPAAAHQSPFAISHEDVEALSASAGFRILRNYLSRHVAFCTQHTTSDDYTKQAWILHRDLLHALIMPVVELFRRSEALARAALCTNKSDDLEMAFTGEARGAFLFMQCFLTEEEDWCRTRGCPACVAIATLSTESHIRLTVAASLLSTAPISSPNSSATTSTMTPSHALPPLPHILPALRTALAADPFWDGAEIWPYLLSRSTQLSASMQSLIISCTDLESLVASPIEERPNKFQKNFKTGPPCTASNVPIIGEQEGGVRLRKSKLAKRQLRLKDEEVELMRRVALQCWARARVPKQIRGEILGTGKMSRTRSQTCP